MPTAAAGIRREHLAAFAAAELARTAPSSAATRYRSLQQFFKWLDDEGEIADGQDAPPDHPGAAAEAGADSATWLTASAVERGILTPRTGRMIFAWAMTYSMSETSVIIGPGA
jgi:hypothetical protein